MVGPINRIYPKIIKLNIDNIDVELESDKHTLNGGKGNKILVDNICEDCALESLKLATEFARRHIEHVSSFIMN